MDYFHLMHIKISLSNVPDLEAVPVNLSVCVDWQHSSPYAVEDEEELNKDTAKGKYTTHQGAGDRVGQPALVRDLTRNLIGPHRLFNGLGGEPMVNIHSNNNNNALQTATQLSATEHSCHTIPLL